MDIRIISEERFIETLKKVANENPFNRKTKITEPHVWSEDVLITLFRRCGTVTEILKSKGIDEQYIRNTVRKRFNNPREK